MGFCRRELAVLTGLDQGEWFHEFVCSFVGQGVTASDWTPQRSLKQSADIRTTSPTPSHACSSFSGRPQKCLD